MGLLTNPNFSYMSCNIWHTSKEHKSNIQITTNDLSQSEIFFIIGFSILIGMIFIWKVK